MPTTQLYAAQHFDDDQLAEEGSRYPAGRLADGTRTILGYFAVDKAHFAGGYFDDAWAGLMAALLTELEQHKGVRDNVQSGARPSGSTSAQAEQGLVKWVEGYKTAVHLAPPELQQDAPRPAPHWKHPAELATDAEPLVEFAVAHPELVSPSGVVIGVTGPGILDAFKHARTAHKVDLANLSPEVRSLHIAEGKVAIELQRLGVAARELLPAARSGLYTVEKLHSTAARHGHGGATGSGSGATGSGSGATGSGSGAKQA